jgi:iron complex transport system ATP-binding protein
MSAPREATSGALASSILEAHDLSLAIPGRTLCAGLCFRVVPGECWAVIGPNGSGKTTLMRALAGLANPAAGEIRYRGTRLADLAPRSRARLRAMLPQDSQDPFSATVLETVLIGRHPHLGRFEWESDDDVALARRALVRFGLADFGHRDVRTLSGGERRRVALAALLVQDPALFLLDEPSSHLDIAQQVSALDVLIDLVRREGKAAVMVLHDLHLAARYCDHAIAIGDGSATAGPCDDVLTARNLTRLFGRELRELGEGRGRAYVPA